MGYIGNIVILVLGVYIFLILNAILTFVFMLVFLKYFDLRMIRFDIYGFNIYKKENKWKIKFIKYAFVNKIYYSFEKKDESIETIESDFNQILNAEYLIGIITSVFWIILSLIMLVLRDNVIIIMNYDLDSLYRDFFIIIIATIIMNLIVTTINKLSRKNVEEHTKYVRTLQKSMNGTTDYKDVNIVPISMLPFKGFTDSEIIEYYRCCMSYFIGIGRTDLLPQIMHDMTEKILKQKYKKVDWENVYELITYYSKYEQNKQWADYFYQQYKKMLDIDEEETALGALTHYTFYMQKDYGLARQYWYRYVDAVNKKSFGLWLQTHRKLINELDYGLKSCGV